MQACRELSRLPKASKLRSINFKRTTPGTVAHLLHGGDLTGLKLVDPRHPAAKCGLREAVRIFPFLRNEAFTLRIWPQAILGRPDFPQPNPPYIPAPKRGPGDDRVNMSLLKVVGKKNLHKSAVVRNKISAKIKTAISLIVTRGADAETDEKGRERLVFKGDGGHHWLLSDWTYLVRPHLEVYSMPYPQLVKLLRRDLPRLKRRALAVDDQLQIQTKRPVARARIEPESTREVNRPPIEAIGHAWNAVLDDIGSSDVNATTLDGSAAAVLRTATALARDERVPPHLAPQEKHQPLAKELMSMPGRRGPGFYSRLLESELPSAVTQSEPPPPKIKGDPLARSRARLFRSETIIPPPVQEARRRAGR